MNNNIVYDNQYLKGFRNHQYQNWQTSVLQNNISYKFNDTVSDLQKQFTAQSRISQFSIPPSLNYRFPENNYDFSLQKKITHSLNHNIMIDIVEPPTLQSDQYCHLQYLNYISKRIKFQQHQQSHIIWYLCQLTEHRIWPIKTLQILIKLLDCLASHQISHVKQIVILSYPTSIDYLMEMEKICVIGNNQLNRFIETLKILIQFCFDFWDYFQRLINYTQVVLSQVLRIYAKQGQTNQSYASTQWFYLQPQLTKLLHQLTSHLSTALTQKSIQKPKLEQQEIIWSKLGRIFIKLLCFPKETIIDNQIIKYIENYLVKKTPHRKQVFKDIIIYNLEEKLKILSKKVAKMSQIESSHLKKDQQYDEQQIVEIYSSLFQEINDQYCISILKISQYNTWKQQEYTQLCKLIMNCGIFTCCSNLEAIKFILDLKKNSMKSKRYSEEYYQMKPYKQVW